MTLSKEESMASHIGRLGRAVLAVGLALVILTGTGGTGAFWSDGAALELGSINAGNVSVTLDNAASRVELHSRQPVGSRTYVEPSTPCTLEAGDTECRVITNFASEALIPGDRIVITEKATLAAQGDNLKGNFEVSAGTLTSAAVSAFSGSATTTSITPPGGNPGSTTSFPVVASTNKGIGTYTVRSTITTPPKNGTADWGTALWNQRLYDGAHTFTFTQTN